MTRLVLSCLLVALLFGGGRTAGAAGVERGITTWSRTQQFRITAPLQPSATPPVFAPDNTTTNLDLVRLTSPELALSCERVKAGLLRELDLPDRWRDRIALDIRPWLPPQAGLFIVSTRYNDGWRYQVEVPETVERRKLLRGLVHVLLQEIANRPAEQEVDIPLWLREGLTGRLLHHDGPDLIAVAEPVRQRLSNQLWVTDAKSRERLWSDPLTAIRQRLKRQPALSFSDLSVPTDEQIIKVGWQHFEDCAHLFVAELQRLPNGAGMLRQFVQNLHRFSHPQFAFLDAFQGHFQVPLDVEKWWSLALVHTLSREDFSRWPQLEALERLNEILRPVVQLRVDTNAVPVTETITLQRLIEDAGYDRQRPVLQQVVTQLQALEWNLPPDLIKLVFDYHLLLVTYLHKRDLAANPAGNKAAVNNVKPVIRDTVKQLDFLDVLRADFARFGFPSTPAAPPPATP